MTDRYQLGHGWSRSALMRPGAGLRDALWHSIQRDVGEHVEIRWRVEGREDWRSSANALKAAGDILALARSRGAVVLEVAESGGGVGPAKWLRLHKYTAEPTPAGSIPAIALASAGTRRTIRFSDEISLAIPDERTLGLYNPRPLKSDIPSGWSTGDRWPAGAYASEHAWAAARNAGVDTPDHAGYSSDPARLAKVLGDVTRYVLANYRRLGAVDHIFNGRRYRRSSSGLYAPSSYTGEDHHTTHTHTAFADHGGRKPPWL